MGDRTTVDLTVPEEHFEATCQLMKAHPENSHHRNGFATLYFGQVNYGSLDSLDLLEEAGIAYDSSWGSGDDYGPGMRSARYTVDGALEIKKVDYDTYNPSLHKLLELLDKPEDLIQFIREHQKAVEHPSWDNQVEYGKFFLAARLITPTI